MPIAMSIVPALPQVGSLAEFDTLSLVRVAPGPWGIGEMVNCYRHRKDPALIYFAKRIGVMFGAKEVQILENQIETSSIEVVGTERRDVPYLVFDLKENKYERTKIDCLVVTFRIASTLGDSFLISQEVPLSDSPSKIESVMNSLIQKSKWALKARLKGFMETLSN